MDLYPALARRSVLYVPASNSRALGKVASLQADAVILDLEDAVAPDEKMAARASLQQFLSQADRPATEIVIRVNALDSPWGAEDLALARLCRPDAILLPKVQSPRDVLEADDRLDQAEATPRIALWAMVETPRAMLNLGAIAALGRDPAARLTCLVAGTNDLAKETGIRTTPDRRYLLPALLQIVMAGRAGNLCVLDGVSNQFGDLDAFSAECQVGRDMGFDGKTLIHPAQIAPANAAFSPSPEEVAEARAIVQAFADNPGKGVLSLDGRMVERLHLAAAERLLARHGGSGRA